MRKLEIRLLGSFQESYINWVGEFIPNKKSTSWFSLIGIKTDFELKCVVLEQLSGETFKRKKHMSDYENDRYQKYMKNGINRFLKHNFLFEDFKIIHAKLGKGCNRQLCKKFISSGYDMNILRKVEKE